MSETPTIATGTPGAGMALPSPHFIKATTFACGALVMVVEILGSRVLGPFFGVGLFVWTALITVTLAALAAGYALGGRIADRSDPAFALYAVILASGLVTLAIPLLSTPILSLSLPLGMRLGALLSAALLFGPTLFLLGCVSPLVVRIALIHPQPLGRTVGNLYALSTIGSVAGALLTGFVLIAHLGVQRIFHLTGVVLILLALLFFLLYRKRRSALAMLLLPLLLLPPEPAVAHKFRDNSIMRVVAAKETFHGSLKVLELDNPPYLSRQMTIDGLIQSGVDQKNGLSIHRYPYFLTLLPRGIHPTGQTALMIGLGAGVIPTWYEAQGVKTDVVDIDPTVVELAREYFNFRPAGRVFIQDARHFLATSQDLYDYILLDVFTGDTTPGHLLSQEAMQLMKQRLAPNGVLAINLIGNMRSYPFMTASVVRTLASVFQQTELRAVYDPDEGREVGNQILVAYQGAHRPFDPHIAARHPIHPSVRQEVLTNLSRLATFPPDTPAIILTDDYNPMEFYDANVKEKLRELIVGQKDWLHLMVAR